MFLETRLLHCYAKHETPYSVSLWSKSDYIKAVQNYTFRVIGVTHRLIFAEAPDSFACSKTESVV